MTRESPFVALAVATLVALGCSALVAAAVHWLRPLAPVETAPARVRAILAAANRLPADPADDDAVLAAYAKLDGRVATLATAELAARPDALAFNHWRDDGAAGAERPIYLARRAGRLETVVFPVEGPGMWSTIRGYVALQPDLATIAGLSIYAHGETPGIGDRIEAPRWLAGWRGKRLFDEAGQPRLEVVANARGAHEIDLISGASVTAEAVGDLVRNAFGPQGYGPVVETLRRTEGR